MSKVLEAASFDEVYAACQNGLAELGDVIDRRNGFMESIGERSWLSWPRQPGCYWYRLAGHTGVCEVRAPVGPPFFLAFIPGFDAKGMSQAECEELGVEFFPVGEKEPK